MKCLRCGFVNNSDSKYCEECGNELTRISSDKPRKANTKLVKHSVSDQITDVEDVIFHPKNKPVSWGNILGVIALVIIGGFLFLAWLGSDSTGSSSNTQTTQETTVFPISYLNIADYETEWLDQELYFTGTLQNKYSEAVKNVFVRVDFYKDKDLTKLIDTRLVEVGGTLANGAFSFQVPLNFYINDRFWWTWKIMEAEGY